MCLAIPAKVVKILDEWRAEVETFGSLAQVNVALIETPILGDYVLVHAGFAIQTIDEPAALESLALWREIYEHAGDGAR